jgi:tetratricopeptide (TPR) repeat protein
MVLDAHAFAKEAAICYSAAEKLDRTNPLWPYYRGILLSQSGPNPEKALPCLERAAGLASSKWPVPSLRLTDLLLALGRTEDARQELQKVLAHDRDNARAQFGLAQVALARHEYRDSLGYLQRIVDDAHTRKRACALRVAVYERLGEREKADQEQRRLAELPEDEPWPDGTGPINQLRVGLRGRILRAQAWLQEAKTAQAVALMEDTAQRYPNSDQSWAGVGMTKEQARDFAGAEQAYRKAIQLAPARSDYHATLGELLQARQRYGEAAAFFRKAIELGPADAPTYCQLGACLQAIGDKQGAADAFRKALQHNPDLTAARQGLDMLSGNP